MPLMNSWVESANTPDTDFPLNNLPYGSFRAADGAAHCGVAIGAMILDVTALETAGHLTTTPEGVFAPGDWTGFMALGPQVWAAFRDQITSLLAEGSDAAQNAGRFPCAARRRADAYAFPGGRIHRFLRGQTPRLQRGHHVPGAGKRAAAKLAVDSDRL